MRAGGAPPELNYFFTYSRKKIPALGEELACIYIVQGLGSRV